jgi:hypothetical protein
MDTAVTAKLRNQPATGDPTVYLPSLSSAFHFPYLSCCFYAGAGTPRNFMAPARAADYSPDEAST